MDKEKINYNLLIAKKTEKIVTAIYLITQFLKGGENIKNDIRGTANKLLMSVNGIAFNEDKNIFVFYKNCLDFVSLLISLLTVAKETNLISKMNCEIVIESLRLLENILIKKQFKMSKENIFINEEEILYEFLNKKDRENINTNTSFDAFNERFINNQNQNEIDINKNFDNIKKDENIINNKNIYLDNINKKNAVVGSASLAKNEVKNNAIDKAKSINDISPDKRHFINDKNISNKSKKNQGRRNNRRDQIMSLFTRGIEVSINDISKKIIGCSIKTLQREINDLVDENKIKRIGDKRWAKYTLNS